MVLRCADDVVDGTEQHARKWEDNLLMDGFTTLLRLNDDVVSSHESTLAKDEQPAKNEISTTFGTSQ